MSPKATTLRLIADLHFRAAVKSTFALSGCAKTSDVRHPSGTNQSDLPRPPNGNFPCTGSKCVVEMVTSAPSSVGLEVHEESVSSVSCARPLQRT